MVCRICNRTVAANKKTPAKMRVFFYIKFIGFTSSFIRTFAGTCIRDIHSRPNGCKCARASPDTKNRMRYQLRATYICAITGPIIRAPFAFGAARAISSQNCFKTDSFLHSITTAIKLPNGGIFAARRASISVRKNASRSPEHIADNTGCDGL